MSNQMNVTESEESEDTLFDFNQTRTTNETPPPPPPPYHHHHHHQQQQQGEEEDEESFNSTNDSLDENNISLPIVAPSSTGTMRGNIIRTNPARTMSSVRTSPRTTSVKESNMEGGGTHRRRSSTKPPPPGGGRRLEETQYFASTFQNPQKEEEEDRKKKMQNWKKQIKSSMKSSYHHARNSVRKSAVTFRRGVFVRKEYRCVDTNENGETPTEKGVKKEKKIKKEEDYYHDLYNDYSWKCTFGTDEDDGIWMVSTDQAGTIMAVLVWIFIIYSGVTVTLLAKENHFPYFLAVVYCTICGLALACHAKTTFTDPGAVPQSAVPSQSCISLGIKTHAMCSICQTFKPPFSHHCRICNRCVSRMDHHCPWMNNCIGAANYKHFILFLIYIWIASVMSLIIFGAHYFSCADENCVFDSVLVHLVRIMTFMCFASLIFTSSVIMNVIYGIMTGIGTIDRMKRQFAGTTYQDDNDAIPLKDIFGIGGYYTWPFPIDPVFDDYDFVMGFSTPQRLLREQSLFAGDDQSNIEV